MHMANDHLTTKHKILLEWRQTENARTIHNIPEFIHQSLGPNVLTIKQTLSFVKEIEIKNLLLTINVYVKTKNHCINKYYVKNNVKCQPIMAIAFKDYL